MSKFKWMILALACTMMASSCFVDIDDDDDDGGTFGCLDGSGARITETLILDSFTGVEVSLPAKVTITQGPVQEVVVEGRESIVQNLELEVRNNIWVITIDGCVNNVGDLNVFITIPDVTSLGITGAGEIISDNVLVIGDLDVDIAGSGDIDLAVEADDIDSEIIGSGKIFLEGIADEIDFEIAGSGDYKTFNLQSRDAEVKIIGSGDAEVFVTDKLKVEISGSGDVFYKGNPSLDLSVTGSGQVVDAN